MTLVISSLLFLCVAIYIRPIYSHPVLPFQKKHSHHRKPKKTKHQDNTHTTSAIRQSDEKVSDSASDTEPHADVCLTANIVAENYIPQP